MGKVKHIVVLALENRSFDHMLGFLKSPSYPLDGLNGHESNPLTFEPGAQEFRVEPPSIERTGAAVRDL
jgi:phospholipase C